MMSTFRFVLLSLFSCGILGSILLLTVGMLSLTGALYSITTKTEKVSQVLPHVVELAVALKDETKAVVLNYDTDRVTAASESSEQREADFVAKWKENGLDEFTTSGLQISDFDVLYSAFHSATGATKELAFEQVNSQLVYMIEAASLSTFDKRFIAAINYFDAQFILVKGFSAVSHVALLQKLNTFTDLDFVISIIGAKDIAEVDVNQQPSVAAMKKTVEDIVVPQADSFKKNVQPVVIDSVESTVSAAVSELDDLNADLIDEMRVTLDRSPYSRILIIQLSLFSALFILTLICFTGTFLVLKRHWYYSRRWATLLSQFQDEEGTSQLRSVYKPLIKDMHSMKKVRATAVAALATSTAPTAATSASLTAGGSSTTNSAGGKVKAESLTENQSSEIEQPFMAAAKLVSSLRPFVPQTLFGDYAAADGAQDAAALSSTFPTATSTAVGGIVGGGGGPSISTNNNKISSKPVVVSGSGSSSSTTAGGAATKATGWDIADETARLEIGSAVVRCTVLLLSALPPPSVDRNSGESLQLFFNHCLAIATFAVNKFGGVIHQVSSDGRILAVWNATHAVPKPAFEALRAAELIRRRFLAGTMFDINISTGSCLISNTKIVDTKHVLFFGYPFELVEKMLTLNRIHEAWLVIDSDTHEMLPRSQQQKCRPIAVLHGQHGESVVAHSYGTNSEPMKGGRWKAYNTAFTLYRNGFLEDAISEYRSYLESYPDDDCAHWLLHHVLLPKQEDPVQKLRDREHVRGDENVGGISSSTEH